MKQLMYQVCYTRYHVSFYLWLIGSALNIVEFQNITTKTLWKFSFCSLYFQMMIQISGKKNADWFKKVNSIKNLAISNGESFLESIFDPN